jgi:hypothetical protein
VTDRLKGAVNAAADALGFVIGRHPQSPPRPPFLSDAPADLTEDAFGVTPIVDRLTVTLATTAPPFTLSLSGSWGIGKSTVAEAVVSRLNSVGTPAVLIDAWTEDTKNLRRTLVIKVGAAIRARGDLSKRQHEEESLAKELDDDTRSSQVESEGPKAMANVPRPHRIRTDRKSLLDGAGRLILRLIPIGVAIVAFVALSAWSYGAKTDSFEARTVPSLLGILLGFIFLGSGFFMVTRTTTTTRGPVEASVAVAERFRRSVTAATGDCQRVLVVVDNLDRLPGAEAVQALSEIRALVEIKGSVCVFLIPVDRDALVRHIKAALTSGEAEGDDHAERAARSYLDKFFSLDLVLTEPAPVDIRDWAVTQATKVLPAFGEPLDGRDEAHLADLRSAVQIVVGAAGSSPRTVKRVLNGISARRRLLDPKQMPSLTQLAFVETLLVEFPELLGWLSEEPRKLQRVRDKLAGLLVLSPEMATSLAAGFDDVVKNDKRRGKLVAFLFSQRDVEVSIAELRRILSLRDDPEWRGVSDPTQLRDAVMAGDAEGFSVALEATPETERSIAVTRAIERVESSLDFSRDAINAILAVVEVIDGFPGLAWKLRSATTKIFDQGDAFVQSRMNSRLASFMFVPPPVERRHESDWRRLNRVASSFVDSLSAGFGSTPTTPDHVAALRLMADHIDNMEKACSALAQLTSRDDGLIEPVFAPTLDLKFVTGPVVETYASRLASIELTEVAPAMTVAAERLVDYRGASGPPIASFGPIAARMAAQITVTSGELPPPVMQILDMSTTFMDDVTSDHIDQLAAALVRPGSQQGACFEMSLRLDSQPNQAKQTVMFLDAWLSGGTLRPDEVSPIIPKHVAKLDANDSAWRDRLVAQWLGTGLTAFAKILVEGDPDAAPGLLTAAAVGAQPDAVYKRATDVFEVAGVGETEAIREANRRTVGRILVSALATWAATAPIGAIILCGHLLAEIEAAGVAVTEVPNAILAQARSATVADVTAYAGAAQGLASTGVKSVGVVVDGLLARATAVGVVDANAVIWLANNASAQSKADAIQLVVSAMGNTTNGVDQIEAIAGQTRLALDRNHRVPYTLVERAAAGIPDAASMKRLLIAADNRWRVQPPETRTTYLTNLSAIAQAQPELEPEVLALKRHALPGGRKGRPIGGHQDDPE